MHEQIVHMGALSDIRQCSLMIPEKYLCVIHFIQYNIAPGFYTIARQEKNTDVEVKLKTKLPVGMMAMQSRQCEVCRSPVTNGLDHASQQCAMI